MRILLRSMFAVLLLAGLIGCGGDAGPPETQFEIQGADVVLANIVRGQLQDMEGNSDPAQVGEMLVENLAGALEDPGAVGHEETYRKIIDAAQKLAGGDASQLAELKALAETLPK